MAGAETQRLVIQLDLAGNATGGIAKLNRQVGLLGRGTARMGKGVAQIGAGFARAGLLVGGAAVTGIGAAAKAAIDFEDAFAGVRKTVDEADLQKAGLSFDKLARSFRDMATEIPISAVEFARIGETAGALGIKANDITRFTEIVAKLGVTTNLTSDAAADALGRVGTILGLTGKEFDEFADSLVGLGNAGASTESEIIEIAKRFAAEGKAAGLLKEDILGLSSAVSSLGFEPERGGSALTRLFGNLATNISTANSKGKALGKGLGRSISGMQKDLNKGKGLAIFKDLLETVRDMKPTEAARFLKSIGVTNVSDRTIIRNMAAQLPFVNEQLEIARKSQGALLAEADKKFATTASKIQLFKNNLIETGIAMGEQFLPAVGRALDQMIAAFKSPEFKSDVQQLGKDIGAAIDGVDWKGVLNDAKDFVGVLKDAAVWAKRIFDAINALPQELKALGLAGITLDKLSGGLVSTGVGNLAGGAATAAASRLPGVGKLFAQPVFVTNWPSGGFGLPGGPGGPGGKPGVPGGAITPAIGAGIAVDVPRLLGIANAKLTAIKAEIAANRGGSGGKSPDERTEQSVNKTTESINRMKASTNEKLIGTTNSIQRMRDSVTDRIGQTKSAIDTTKAAVNTQGSQTRVTVRAAEAQSAARIVAATAAQTGAIVGAIFAARPLVNVTNVVRSTTIQQRYGPGNGSSGSDHGGSIGFGGGN